MTDNNMCDCVVFLEGDWVESKLNDDIIGIVVGDSDFGRFVNVQLTCSLEIKPFYAVTLRHVYSEPEPSEGNVIDFTKAKALKKSTKTKGVA